MGQTDRECSSLTGKPLVQESFKERLNFTTTCSGLLSAFFKMSRNLSCVIDFSTFSFLISEDPASLIFSSRTFCCFRTALKSWTTPLKIKQETHGPHRSHEKNFLQAWAKLYFISARLFYKKSNKMCLWNTNAPDNGQFQRWPRSQG